MQFLVTYLIRLKNRLHVTPRHKILFKNHQTTNDRLDQPVVKHIAVGAGGLGSLPGPSNLTHCCQRTVMGTINLSELKL